jgi:DNA-binding response OmpR family regulator
MKPRLLLVEDEPGLVLTLTDRLRAAGFELESTGSAREAWQWLQQRAYQIVVLDVMLNDGNGFDLCRRLRERDPHTPVLMLTALGAVDQRVRGLAEGADDYLCKPFDGQELSARLQALLRRSRMAPAAPPDRLCFGAIEMQLASAECRVDGRLVTLSARLFALLRHFLLHPNQVISRDRLLNEVWGYDSLPNTRTVDVHIGWLRRQIEIDPANPTRLLTVHRLGYKLVEG